MYMPCCTFSMLYRLNTVREVCVRCPLVMTRELLADLAGYKTYRDRGVVMAARSLIQLYRNVRPELLQRKDRVSIDISFHYQITVCPGTTNGGWGSKSTRVWRTGCWRACPWDGGILYLQRDHNIIVTAILLIQYYSVGRRSFRAG